MFAHADDDPDAPYSFDRPSGVYRSRRGAFLCELAEKAVALSGGAVVACDMLGEEMEIAAAGVRESPSHLEHVALSAWIEDRETRGIYRVPLSIRWTLRASHALFLPIETPAARVGALIVAPCPSESRVHQKLIHLSLDYALDAEQRQRAG
jgi:hypothetical protein